MYYYVLMSTIYKISYQLVLAIVNEFITASSVFKDMFQSLLTMILFLCMYDTHSRLLLAIFSVLYTSELPLP